VPEAAQPLAVADTMETTLVEESSLVGRCRAGDAAAFDALVARHASVVYNLAYRMLGDPDDAEDAAQTAFIRAYTSIRAFRGGSSFGTWLYRIALNICLDQLKSRRRQPEMVSELPETVTGAPLAPPSDDPESAVLRGERQELIQTAINSLPEAQRVVLVLSDLQGMTYEEIVEITGATLGTVKSRLNRARISLKVKLEQHLELLR